MTWSFGLVSVGTEATTFRELLEAADGQMYARKRGTGRAAVEADLGSAWMAWD